jgi:hypothetical protein
MATRTERFQRKGRDKEASRADEEQEAEIARFSPEEEAVSIAYITRT